MSDKYIYSPPATKREQNRLLRKLEQEVLANVKLMKTNEKLAKTNLKKLVEAIEYLEAFEEAEIEDEEERKEWEAEKARGKK